MLDCELNESLNRLEAKLEILNQEKTMEVHQFTTTCPENQREVLNQEIRMEDQQFTPTCPENLLNQETGDQQYTL